MLQKREGASFCYFVVISSSLVHGVWQCYVSSTKPVVDTNVEMCDAKIGRRVERVKTYDMTSYSDLARLKISCQ